MDEAGPVSVRAQGPARPGGAWRGAVCRLVEDGFSVLHSLDAEDSAAWIVRLAKRARRPRPTIRTEGPRRAPAGTRLIDSLTGEVLVASAS